MVSLRWGTFPCAVDPDASSISPRAKLDLGYIVGERASLPAANLIDSIMNIVLYDGECPLCIFQSRVLGWLDWFNVLALVPLSDARAKEIAPQIGREDLIEAIHCIAPDGRIYRGARCIRFVGMRLPLMVPVSLFLWLPGVIYVAERIYAWISRNRLHLSRFFGCKDACSIMPVRKREQDTMVGPGA
jgi:predicted DCC family thiol-disulfide oxidoreductase YuxK